MQSERDVVSSGTKLSRPTVLAQTSETVACVGRCFFWGGVGGGDARFYHFVSS